MRQGAIDALDALARPGVKKSRAPGIAQRRVRVSDRSPDRVHDDFRIARVARADVREPHGSRSKFQTSREAVRVQDAVRSERGEPSDLALLELGGASRRSRLLRVPRVLSALLDRRPGLDRPVRDLFFEVLEGDPPRRLSLRDVVRALAHDFQRFDFLVAQRARKQIGDASS